MNWGLSFKTKKGRVNNFGRNHSCEVLIESNYRPRSRLLKQKLRDRRTDDGREAYRVTLQPSGELKIIDHLMIVIIQLTCEVKHI